MLPMLSRSHVDRLISELQNAEFKLEFEPTNTLEYVESLNFLEEIQERVSIYNYVIILLCNSCLLFDYFFTGREMS